MPSDNFEVKFDKTGIRLTQSGFMEKHIEGDVSKILLEAALFMEGEIAKKTPIGGTGNLRRSIHGELVTPLMSHVFSGTTYGVFVEEGTSPHPVSQAGREALALWAKRKFGVDDKEAKSIAFLVARKIGKKGTKPQKMFENALNDNRTRLETILQKLSDKFTEGLNA